VRTLEVPILQGSSMYVGPIRPTVHKITKVTRLQGFWKGYVPEQGDCRQVYIPTSICDTLGELVHVTRDIFTPTELSFLTKEAAWLEKAGGLTLRGKKKEGSRMVVFGLYNKYGTQAW